MRFKAGRIKTLTANLGKIQHMALVTGKRIKQTDRQTNKLVDYFKGIDSM